MIRMFDSLKATGINAVFFQVRSDGEALYASELAPWAYGLTGKQGRAVTKEGRRGVDTGRMVGGR